MANKLRGFDVSHHNGSRCINAIMNEYNNQFEFVIIKATEGKTYKDPQCLMNIQDAKNNLLLFGLYHYARPENNSYVDEAENFLSVYKDYIGQCIPCLDWEQEALKYPDTWALGWLDYIYQKTGVRPVLYVQQSEVKNMVNVAKNNYGLWVARWNNEPGSVYPWPYYTMWQYTSSPFDMNNFNGSKEQFMKYCTPIKDATIPDNNEEINVSCDGEIVVRKGDTTLWRGKIILSSLQDSEGN